MIIRGVGKTVLALALVLGAVACNDDPTSEGRQDGEYIQLSSVDAAVEAGDTVRIIANVMNRYGSPTYEAVTAEPCDSKVTSMVDPTRSGFEAPESFLVIGNTLGRSCVVFRGGGVTDSAIVRVVPASLTLADLDTLNSGEVVSLAPVFYNIAGAPVTGLTAANLSYTVLSPSIAAVSATGELSAQAPGETLIVATLTGFGVARADTFSVPVKAGPFGGTVTQSAGRGGQILTFTEGAFPFDEDTKVRIIGANDSTVYLDVVGTTVLAAVPFGTPAGTDLDYAVINMGPGQVAAVGTFTTTAGNTADTWTGTDDPGTAPSLTIGESVVAQVGGTDDYDYFTFTVTEAGTYELQVDWNNDADIDIGIINPGFTAYLGTGWTAANPEHVELELEPGTYFIEIYNYDDSGNADSTYRIRLVHTGGPAGA